MKDESERGKLNRIWKQVVEYTKEHNIICITAQEPRNKSISRIHQKSNDLDLCIIDYPDLMK